MGRFIIQLFDSNRTGWIRPRMTGMVITHGQIFVFCLTHVPSKIMAEDRSLTAVSHRGAIKRLEPYL